MSYTIAIIGLGLMGGSLAFDLSEWKKKSTITGYDINEETQKWCQRMGIIDRFSRSPEEAVEGADLVFIATPVRTIPAIYSTIRSYLTSKTITFDLGSTRQWIFQHLLPRPEDRLYCGFHPMGGSEKNGVQYARRRLFAGVPVLVTPYQFLVSEKKQLIEEIAHCMESQVFFYPRMSTTGSVPLSATFPMWWQTFSHPRSIEQRPT